MARILGVALIQQPSVIEWATWATDLWREVEDGTFVLRDRSPAELAEGRARAKRIYEGSHVPWILNDIGGLLQFYDDAQDVVAFATWNKRIFAPAGLRACLSKATARGLNPISAYFSCVCPGARAHGKRASESSMVPWGAVGGALAAAFGFLVPGAAAIGYVLLAGQVSYSLFGVGLKLGPIVGAFLEAGFRGLDALGLPFGPEHNKYHQLRAARLLQRAERGWNASRLLGVEEWAASTAALRQAYGYAPLIVPRVFSGSDYPRWDFLYGRIHDLVVDGDVRGALDPEAFLTDAYGTARSLGDLAFSLPQNVAAYVFNDLLGAATSDASLALSGQPLPGRGELTPQQRAMLALGHRGRCPAGGVCGDTIDNRLAFEEWRASTFTGGGRRRRPPGGPLDDFPVFP